MSKLLKGIVLDMEQSLGTLRFVGHGAERTKRTQVGQNVVTERIYNMRSSVQKGNIEVIVKGNRPPLHFDVLEEVVLKNPIFESGSQNSQGMSFVDYKLYADSIIAAKDVEK